MTEDERYEMRILLLWQEGLICVCCKAAELSGKEVEQGLCNECVTSFKALADFYIEQANNKLAPEF